MLTEKVIIEGKEYQVSAATYKMLREAVNELHISIKNYNNQVKEESDVTPPPAPLPQQKTKRARAKRSKKV